MRTLARYSRAATPWGLAAVTGAIATVLVLLVARWPDTLWPLHGAAIGMLAGVSAWSADERSATVVDVAPRPLWWRTLARAPAPLLLVAAWIVTHLSVRDRLPDHVGVLVLQGAGAAAAGFATATARRTAGDPDPGHRIALVVCPFAVAIALARPWAEHVPLFPVWPYENWRRASVIWLGIGGMAVVVLAAALFRDATARRRTTGR